MHLRDPAAIGQMPRQQIDFGEHVIEVLLRHVLPFGDHHVAAAEETALLAERQVRVHRERLGGERVGHRQALAIVGLGESGMELDRGRIGRVARPRTVVAGQQLGRRSGPARRRDAGTAPDDPTPRRTPLR